MPEAAATPRGRHKVQLTLEGALQAGEIIQMPDGRAAYWDSTLGESAGAAPVLKTDGQVTVTKTAGVVILAGGRVFWDHDANSATFRPGTNDRDFYLGTCVNDAASADTTLTVNLNAKPSYIVDLAGQHYWTTEATNGEGVSLLPGNGVKLSFDAVAEAAQAAIYSRQGFAVDSNAIVEMTLAIFDVGDDAALDIDFGAASGSHATDFESVAEFVTVHVDGNDLSLTVQSDDGTTDVAAVDTTVDAVDDTFLEVWLDFRDPSDVQVYVDGVLVLGGSTFTLAAASGPLFPIIHMEKTSNDTTADVRVERCVVRTSEQ